LANTHGICESTLFAEIVAEVVLKRTRENGRTTAPRLCELSVLSPEDESRKRGLPMMKAVRSRKTE
jgi:hypothetical protein